MKASVERSGGAGVIGKRGKDEDRLASDPQRAGNVGQVESRVAVCSAPTLVGPASAQKVLGQSRWDPQALLCPVACGCLKQPPQHGPALGSTRPLL